MPSSSTAKSVDTEEYDPSGPAAQNVNSEHRKSLHKKNDALILKSLCKLYSSAMRATQIAPFPISGKKSIKEE